MLDRSVWFPSSVVRAAPRHHHATTPVAPWVYPTTRSALPRARMARVNLYAQTPGRRARQLIGDLLVLGWVVLWVRAGLWVHEVVGRLAAPDARSRTPGRRSRTA